MNRKAIVTLLSLILFSLPNLAYADDFSLTVKPEITENHQGNNKNVFNLRMDPGEEKEYTLHVKNKGDRDKKVEVSIVNAGTLTAGVIDETNQNAKMVAGANNLLTDLAELSESEILIPANESKDVNFKITTPKEGMIGIALGGIYVLDKNENVNEQSKGESGVSIHNQMGYPTEIVLSTSDKQVEAKLALDKVQITSYGGKPALEIPLQNVNPNIVPDLTVETEVTKKGKTEIEEKNKKENIEIAPQSIFNHIVRMGDKKISPGTYSAHIKAKSEYGSWEWDREFVVSNEKAKEMNQNAKTLNVPSWLYFAIILLVLLLLLVFYLIYKNRQLKKGSMEEK